MLLITLACICAVLITEVLFLLLPVINACGIPKITVSEPGVQDLSAVVSFDSDSMPYLSVVQEVTVCSYSSPTFCS